MVSSDDCLPTSCIWTLAAELAVFAFTTLELVAGYVDKTETKHPEVSRLKWARGCPVNEVSSKFQFALDIINA